MCDLIRSKRSPISCTCVAFCHAHAFVIQQVLSCKSMNFLVNFDSLISRLWGLLFRWFRKQNGAGQFNVTRCIVFKVWICSGSKQLDCAGNQAKTLDAMMSTTSIVGMVLATSAFSVRTIHGSTIYAQILPTLLNPASILCVLCTAEFNEE